MEFIKMVQELDAILDILPSEKAKLAFLKNIYLPGNIKVTDSILAINKDDSSVLKQEIAYAKQVGESERFISLAKKYIDYYISHDYDILLKDVVIEWKNSELADYAIEEITLKPEDNRGLERPLEFAVEIAQAFGENNKSIELLERLLALQERDSEHKSTVAKTLEKLGRFEDAIDKYLEEKSAVSDAFNLAKKHSPERLHEIANVEFDNYKPGFSSAKFYVKCAEILGKTKEAENKLVKYAKKVKVKDLPKAYTDVVELLVSFRQVGAASKLVKKVAENEEKAKNSGKYYEFDRLKETAQLYHVIGETEAVKNIYMEIIDRGIKERDNPSITLNYIRTAIELTDNQIFKEREIDFLVLQGEYRDAATLATELGKPDLAQTYLAMQDMVDAVKAPGVK